MFGFVPSAWMIKLGLFLAAVGAICLALLKVYNAGKAAERVNSLNKALKNVGVRQDVEADVRKLNSDDLDKQLQFYFRD